MGSMFRNLSVIPELDLTRFDTSNVTSMSDMFTNSYALEELDLTSFNTSKVTSMGNMFYGTSSLTEIRVSNLWDMSSVTNTSGMFDRSGVSSVTVVS